MDNQLKLQAFSLVTQKNIAKRTGAAYSSLSKWKVTRPYRVMLLEVGAMFHFFSESERTAILSSNKIDFPELLNRVGLSELNITSLVPLLQESRRTLYSWWAGKSLSKKRQLLFMIEGLLCLLAIAKCPNMDSVFNFNEDQMSASRLAEINQDKVDHISFLAFKLSLQKINN